MSRYGNEDMAWQRLLDVQREAENRRLVASGGAPTVSGLAGVIAEVAYSFVHALGLAPRWWSGDAGAARRQDASEPTPAPHPAPRRRLEPRG